MNIKRNISNWNIKIIFSVLIVVGAGNPELLLPVECNNLNLESDQSEPPVISSENDILRKIP